MVHVRLEQVREGLRHTPWCGIVHGARGRNGSGLGFGKIDSLTAKANTCKIQGIVSEANHASQMDIQALEIQPWPKLEVSSVSREEATWI